MSTDGVAVWLYAVIRGEVADDRVGGLTGVEGERVRHLDDGDLSAIVGTVHLDEFGEAALRRNLENLDWLSVKARAHDAVISAIARSGPDHCLFRSVPGHAAESAIHEEIIN